MATMSRCLLQSTALLSTLILLSSLPLTSALKFDLQAYPQSANHKHDRCIRNFVAKDTLVVVTATVSGHKGDGQMLSRIVEANVSPSAMQIKDAVGNDYGRPKDIAGESRMAFTSHADSAFDVCFENILISQREVINPTRHIELDIDIGADARDWSAIQAAEKLKPVETELRRIEEMVGEIVTEMDYLRTREQKLRDTNESTNERVKWFAFGTMGMLVGLGVWQVHRASIFAYRGDMADQMHQSPDQYALRENSSAPADIIPRLFTNNMLHVYVGPNRKHWNLHRDLLCARSKYFKAALGGDFKEAQDKAISYPDEDPAVFGLFISWLYCGTLQVPMDKCTLTHYFKLYVLADKFSIEALKNLTIDAIREHYRLSGCYAGASRIEYIYSNTASRDPMRKFLVDSLASWYATEQESPDDEDDALLKAGGDIASDMWKALIRQFSYPKDPTAEVSCMYHEHKDTEACGRVSNFRICGGCSRCE
ncbi:MAG: vesicle coat component [Candelina mexicana]|nr:MAG: vesicle coat component [Candelina mexicana]